MKRSKLIALLIVSILLLNGCSARSRQTDDTALPGEDNATEITIEVWDNTSFIRNAAQKFEQETGVKVNIINDFRPGGTNEEYTANEDRIQAELMAGKGADIYAGLFLDFANIGKNKHLCNLGNWIAAEPEFSDDAYYMKILTSGFDDGELYAIPLFMFFNALGSTIEVPELYGKTLNWEEFFELTKGIKRSGILYGIQDYSLFIRRFAEQYDRFIDEENKTQSLDSQEMVKLLEQCKEWSTEGLCIPYNAENFTELWENSFFIEPGGGDIDMLTNFRFDNPYLDNEYYYYDMPSDSGKHDKANKIMSTDFICINAASPYKGTAWKFVKFLLREDIQVNGNFTPVNRKAATEHVSKTLNETIDFFGLDVDPDEIIVEGEAILDAVDQVPYGIYPTELEKIVDKEARRFFTNEITAAAAAKNMAAGVQLYFKEQ